jgi:3-oxoacyl-[acyl-carrier protein] reductase
MDCAMNNTNLRLEGKVALITGASRGLGRAMAIRFAQEGAAVAINYCKNQDAAEEVRKIIVSAGGKGTAVQADVAKSDQVQRMVETVLKMYGSIDILVNNAGIVVTAPTLMEASWQDLDRMIDVNLRGVVYCVQAVAKGMMERRYGRIINLSSIAAMGTSFVGTTGYAATKAAVMSLTKRLALELGPHNITVNAIAPGFIKTEMALSNGDVPRTRSDLETIARKTMLGRLGEPEDIAHTALFLASGESCFMTAQILTVDGGRIDFLSHSS